MTRDQEIIHLYGRKWSATMVGRRVGMSRDQIYRVLRENGITLRARGGGKARPPRFAEKGAYPLRLDPPVGKVWCRQCDALVATAQAERCASAWCKVKAA
jgi:hypothetical protein